MYKCDVCGTSFYFKGHLDSHKKHKHPKPSEAAGAAAGIQQELFGSPGIVMRTMWVEEAATCGANQPPTYTLAHNLSSRFPF